MTPPGPAPIVTEAAEDEAWSMLSASKADQQMGDVRLDQLHGLIVAALDARYRAGAETALEAVRSSLRSEARTSRWTEDEADSLVIGGEVALDLAREKLGLGGGR